MIIKLAMFQLFSFQVLNDVPKALELHNKTSDQATDMDNSEGFDVTITNNPTYSQHKMKKQRSSPDNCVIHFECGDQKCPQHDRFEIFHFYYQK